MQFFIFLMEASVLSISVSVISNFIAWINLNKSLHKISDPYERPVENIEYDEWHRKYYPAAFVDPLSDLLRCHRCEIVQFGESRSAWKWLRRRSTAVDGRDAANRTRIRILILLYSHRWDVDRTRKTLETIDIYNFIVENCSRYFSLDD